MSISPESELSGSGPARFDQREQTNQAQTNIAGNATGPILTGPTFILGNTGSSLPTGDPAAMQQLQSILQIMFPNTNQGQIGSIQNYRPRPQLRDLFEVITDPDLIPATLFRTDPAKGITPYQVEYINGRETVDNVQAELQQAVLKSSGRLLVQGRSGIGKTREVAELARAWCEMGWTVCVARSQGDSDARLGPLDSFPAEFSDARLLVILDNLHQRVPQPDEKQIPYPDRLEAFLSYLEERLIPGASLFVIGISPTEPKFQKLLGFDPARPPWQRFRLYELPEFSLEGLKQMLDKMASEAKIPVEDIEALVENSDRKPATIVENIKLARVYKRPLNRSSWIPTRNLSWQNGISSAQASHPATTEVYQALYLLTKMGLISRMPYLLRLSSVLAGQDTRETIDYLLDIGLVGRRGEVVSIFSQEQLEESLQILGKAGLDANSFSSEIVRAVRDTPVKPKGWTSDLLVLAFSLIGTDQYELARELADLAIQNGKDSAQAYLARGAAQFRLTNWAASESDVTLAIERAPEEVQLRMLRGSIRSTLGDFEGLLADMDFAIQQGHEDALAYSYRAWAHYNLGNLQLAEADYNTALDKKDTGEAGFWYYMRGLIRYALGDYPGSEADMTMVLERGMPWNYIEAVQALSKGDWGEFEEQIKTTQGPETTVGNGYVYLMRSVARLQQGKYAEAEADTTQALNGDLITFMKRLDSMLQLEIPGLKKFQEGWAAVRSQLLGNLLEANLYHNRGVTRFYQLRYAEAEQDFDLALANGIQDTNTYVLRGIARQLQGKFALAASDYDSAIAKGRQEAQLYLNRGMMRQCLQRPADAEADCNQAIERGQDDAAVYFWRGMARLSQSSAEQAETDFQMAIDRGLDNALVYLYRGSAKRLLGKASEAEADFELAQARGANDPGYYVSRGELSAQQGDFAHAERDLTTAIAMGGDSAYIYHLLGVVHSQLNKWTEAESDFNASLERDPASADSYLMRGQARYHLNQAEEAEQDIRSALEKGRRDVHVYSLLAAIAVDTGKYAEAEKQADMAIGLGRQDGGIYLIRGEARRQQDRFQEAEQDFNLAIQHGMDDADIYYRRGLARAGQEDYSAAESDFTTALAHAEDSISFYQRAAARRQQGKYAEAETDYDEAITRGKADASAFAGRGETRFHLNKFAEAVDDLNKVIELGRENAFIFWIRGASHLFLSHLPEAESDFDKSLTFAPDNPEILYMRALCRSFTMDLAGAEQDFKQAIAHGKEDAEVYQGLADTALHLDKLEEAEDYCASAAKLASEASETWRVQGLLSMARCDYEGAVLQLQKAIQTSTNSAEHADLGLTYLLAGRLEEALQEYQLCVSDKDSLHILNVINIRNELDFWTAKQADRLAAPEAQQALQKVRTLVDTLPSP